MLLGSSIVPTLIVIGAREVQLGEIVRRAFVESGLDVEHWNALQALDREARIAKIIYDMRAEAERRR